MTRAINRDMLRETDYWLVVVAVWPLHSSLVGTFMVTRGLFFMPPKRRLLTVVLAYKLSHTYQTPLQIVSSFHDIYVVGIG